MAILFSYPIKSPKAVFLFIPVPLAQRLKARTGEYFPVAR